MDTFLRVLRVISLSLLDTLHQTGGAFWYIIWGVSTIKIEGAMMKRKQKVLNLIYGSVFGGILFLIVMDALKLEPLTFLGNFVVYVFLVIGVLVLLPLVLGFAFRYFAVKKLDDMYGQPDEHIPNILQVFGMLVTGIGVGWFWMEYVVQLCSKVSTLNTWAWPLIRFTSTYENDPIGWFWASIILYCIGYGIGSIAAIEKK